MRSLRIFNSGSSVGAIIAPPLVAWIILIPDGAAFLMVGLTGIAWLLVWWPVITCRKP